MDQTKRSVMQSHLKYREYYDRKARAAPLKEKDFWLSYNLKRTTKDLKSHLTIIGGLVLTLSKRHYLMTTA